MLSGSKADGVSYWRWRSITCVSEPDQTSGSEAALWPLEPSIHRCPSLGGFAEVLPAREKFCRLTATSGLWRPFRPLSGSVLLLRHFSLLRGRQTAVMQASYISAFSEHFLSLEVPRQRRSGEVLSAVRLACAAIW